MSRVLITGANGFIGRAVCQYLRSSGYTLSGTTRDANKKRGPANIPLYNIPQLGIDTDWLPSVSGAEAIVHLAARVHVMRDFLSDPLVEFRRVNRDETIKLAEAAVSASVKRLIFVSTVKVNGEVTENRSFSETDTPSPLDPYAISKWEAEKSLVEISHKTELEVVILRVPLVYGPYVKGNFLKLVKACAGRRLLPLGAIANARSFLYVSNLASAVKTCLEHPFASGKIYLVSDGQDLSTPDLVRGICGALGLNDRLYSWPRWLLTVIGGLTFRLETVKKLTESLQVDSSLIKQELQWSPPFTVQEGLNETARWFIENRVS